MEETNNILAILDNYIHNNPDETSQLFANAVITAMQKLQTTSKSFLTTQGPEIRADKTILVIFTIIMLYYLISK